MFEIKNYSLEVKGKVLFEKTDVFFEMGKINHILGKNGVGKSQFAKDLLLNNSREIPKEILGNVTVIGSFSNVPYDISTKDIFSLLERKYDNFEVHKLSNYLSLDNISKDTPVGKLSDGQKQKLKLLSFLLEDKQVIVLDEVTNALDKTTTNEIYDFLNTYVEKNPNKFIINITHNLSDLQKMQGNYYLLEHKKIVKIADKDEAIKKYIEG